jgi:hypothetical protein
MELYPSDRPSMNNIYNSDFTNKVREDELRRGQKIYSKSNIQLNNISENSYSIFNTTQSSDNAISSLTGERIDMKDFKHNNMQPYLKGNVTQNTNIEKFTAKLDYDTGVDKLYLQKKENINMFKPITGLYNINGAQSSTDFIKSRMEISKINNNILPFEKQYIGPGLNKGYTTDGSGGFQQMNSLDYARPKSFDELRSKVNQKETIYKLPFQSPVKGPEQRGIAMPFSKNKPETVYAQTEDNWFKTTGAILKDTTRSELALKNTTKPDLHAEYTGGAKLQDLKGIGEYDDYGKINIEVYDTQRQKTECKTVVSNLTTNIKAIIAPIMDAVKISLKEYAIDSARIAGNAKPQLPNKLALHDPNDTMKTTVKETVLQESDNLNLNGPNETYSALQDEAKTTVKETILQDSDYLNIKSTTSSYFKTDDSAKTTNKETLPCIDTERNIGTKAYRVYMYNPELAAKKTVKQTTIKGNSELGFIGGLINSILGGYATKNIDIRSTHKQFTTDNNDFGIASAIYEFRPRNREAEEGIEFDGARESLLIEAGHTPNSSRMNIPIDTSDILMTTKRLIEDSIPIRKTGNTDITYQQTPTADEIHSTRNKIFRNENVENAYANRLDTSLLDPLRNNPLNLKCVC